MASPPSPSMAGGFPIAAGILLGTAAGLFWHQPTIGLLVGLAIGVVVALLLWVRGR